VVVCGIYIAQMTPELNNGATLACVYSPATSREDYIFENKFPYISVIHEASDFKFGKAHHKIPRRKKVGVAMG